MTYRHIAVAVSGEPDDQIIVKKALDIARHDNAFMTLVHIHDGLGELYSGVYIPSAEDIIRAIDAVPEKNLNEMVPEAPWPKTRLVTERGAMPETLLEVVQKEGCDLLICGHHHSFLNRLMPFYRSIINRMATDLLIVPLTDNQPGA
ncbi:universal stress protein UspD [Salmonella enterica subsp. enterica serovar Give]|nr:universal stress protein UspD [Salmonella enterica subsp. enterica serovar Give]